LTPYEIKFNERRQFFTEGTELFSKADLFYSRRIGGRPVGFDRVYEDLLEYEEVRRNPSSTNLLNATKLSGRTDFGLGIGVLNAMTREAKAWVVDTESGGDRWIVTQPFTNYNLLVLEQTLVPHSYVSLVNSNVWRQNYVANVTGTEVALADRSNTYRVKGIGALSRIQHEERTRNGFKAFVDAGKISGRFQYRYDLSVISDDYDQNDMGYLRRNNEVVHRGSFSHNVFQPFGWFLGMTNQIQWIYSRVYKPSDFSESVFRYDFSADFKNHYYLTAYAAWAPTDRKDYYEPRVPGRFYIAHKFYETGFTVQTDPRQTFSSLFEAQISRAYDYSFDVRSWSALVSPLLRLSDHFQLRLEYFYGVDRNQPGFVDADFENGNIYFGKRDRNTGTATVEAKYMWTNRSSLECRLRHYWSRVTYDSFYLLQEDGGLRPLGRGTGDPFSRDVQYNAFNLDLTYRWEFAPGSELLVNWKNAIYTSDQLLSGGHWHNLRHTLSAPQTNSISIKFLYYLDYLELVGSSRSSR
jgi:hypothetical protein